MKRSVALLLPLFFVLNSKAAPAVIIEKIKPILSGTRATEVRSRDEKSQVEEESDEGSSILKSTSKISQKLRAKSDLLGSETKKIALKGDIGGMSGLFGIHLQLKLDPKWNQHVSLGGASGLTTFTFGTTYLFSEEIFRPYAGLFLSHWLGQVDSAPSRPQFLKDRLLSRFSFESNRYDFTFIAPAVGVEWNLLPYDAPDLFLAFQIDFPFELKTKELLPTGGVGIGYQF